MRLIVGCRSNVDECDIIDKICVGRYKAGSVIVLFGLKAHAILAIAPLGLEKELALFTSLHAHDTQLQSRHHLLLASLPTATNPLKLTHKHEHEHVQQNVR